MGIQDIWNFIKPTAITMKLADYTLENRNASDLVCRIGIDAQALLRGFRAVDPSTVFIQTYDFLCHLCRAPAADFIFVYASPESGVNVNELEQFKELLKAFSYHIHVTEAEVNAELSAMSNFGLIKAILTNDGNIFPFGANCVLSLNRAESSPTSFVVDVYCARTIQERLGISKEGFILIALIVGSDYNEGIHGIGMMTAIALAKCGYGEALLRNYHQFSQSSHLLDSSFVELNCSIADEIESNSRHYLRRRSPQRAHAFLDAHFPSSDTLRTLKMFTEPITDLSPSSGPQVGSKWVYNIPHPPKIAAFCRKYFRWSSELVNQKFRSELYAGVIIRMLCSKYVVYNPVNGEILVPLVQSHFDLDHSGRPYAFTLSTTIGGKNPPSVHGKELHDAIDVDFSTSFFTQVAGLVCSDEQMIRVAIPAPILAVALRLRL
ncbi:uncharacterized protein C8R40DRAFT_1167025 [Lentinula edodes]|uniref:uncharacterized protein n=1 Tax=Lentinula edodes TaxID=5353 RepID=UPI001E8DD034|nr:uncharacterized protein C8R40DRAFT_1167025 [Lentinula edodes]KAH7879066.1 hypothetical protein C8R40DRAFT_1167025 [Lentinula edodes]